MNPEDFPINPAELTIQDFIIEPAGGTGSPEMDYYLARRLAIPSDKADEYLNAVHNSATVIAANTEPGVMNLMKEQITANIASIKENKLDMFSDDLASPNPILSTAEAAGEVASTTDGEVPSYQKLVESLIARVKGTPEDFGYKETARLDAIKTLLYAYMQERGIDLQPSGWDIAGAMIPGRELVQLGLPGSIEEKANWFRQMSIDDQFNELVNIFGSAFKSSDNDLIKADALAPYLNPADIAEVKRAIALSTFDAVTVLPFTKILKVIRTGNSTVRLLKDIGEVKKAAQVNEAAMRSEAAAKAAGTTQADAIVSSSPFSSTGIDPALTEGISANVQKIIADGVTQTADDLRPLHDDTLLTRREWTPAEIEATNAKWLRNFGGSAKLVKSAPDGSLFEIGITRLTAVDKDIYTLSERIDELTRTTLRGEASLIHLKGVTTGIAGDVSSELTRQLKLNLVDAKAELANLKAIRDLDVEKDSLTVRMSVFQGNNPEFALNKDYKKLLSAIEKNKAARTKLVDKLKTKTVETQDVERKFVRFTEDDFGVQGSIELSMNKSAHINAPSTYMHDLLPGAVSRARNIGFTVEQMKGIYQKTYSNILGKLSGSQRRNLDKILLQGDEETRVYNVTELINGVRTPHGLLKLDTEAELTAYYQTRRVADDLYTLKNRELHRKLQIEGYQAFSAGDKILLAKPKNAMLEIPSNVQRIFDVATGKIIDRRLLDRTEKVYKLRKSVGVGNEDVTYAIAREADFHELPTNIIDYRPGYIPKIRREIYHVGQLIGPRIVDGVEVANSRKVVRFFDNSLDTEIWKKEMAANGTLVEVKSTAQWFDENPTTINEWEELMFGSTYEASRTDGVIPLNLSGTGVERIGALESLEAYMNHVSTRIPTSDFRLALVRRFENAAKDPLTGESFLNRSGDWRDPLAVPHTHPAYRGLKAQQDWTKAQLAIKSTEERKWDEFAYNISSIATKSPILPRQLSRAALKVGTTDLTGLMRTAAFHATLGWFNPSQLIVQGLGFTTALAIDPLGAPINLAKYIAMRAAMSVREPGAIKRAAAAAGEELTEFTEMVHAYQRTGLHQSVRTLGHYGVETTIHPSRQILRSISDKGLIFFNAGERFVRGFAWVQAWRKLYKPGMKVTDAFIDSVTNESVRYTLDLNRANRAYWQTGILGIPTQFQQITTKFAENFLYKGEKLEAGWSRGEKVRIALANAVLFGAAGVPLGKSMVNNALAYLRDDSDFGLAITDPVQLTALSGGLVEAGLYGTLGATPSISERTSLVYGIQQFIENFTDDSSTPLEIAAGVFGELPKRSVKALGHLTQMYAAVLHEPEVFEPVVLAEMAADLASLTSTYTNGRKARIWYINDALMNAKGTKLSRLEGKQKATIVLSKALGFSPKQLEEFGDLKNYNIESSKIISESANKWVEIVTRYSGSEILKTPEGSRRVAGMIEFILSDLTYNQRKKVAESVKKRLVEQDFALSKELLKFIENTIDRHGDNVDVQTNTLLLPNENTNAQ